jgi:hypothetical protein
MNERVEQLRLEAFRYSKEQHPNDIVEWAMCMSAKLVELTVRECADVMSKKNGPKSALNVLDHFGVEA